VAAAWVEVFTGTGRGVLMLGVGIILAGTALMILLGVGLGELLTRDWGPKVFLGLTVAVLVVGSVLIGVAA